MAEKSTPSSHYRIEPLNRTNYDTWVIQAQAVLIKNGLWETLLSTKPDEQKELLARSELILLISPAELKNIKSCKTASEIWTKLKSIYQSEGPARKAALLKQLILKRMSDSENVVDHLSNLFDCVDKLASMDVPVNDDLLSIIILYSLPTTYENFRIAIETRDTLPKPEELKIKIIEESQARNRGTENMQGESAFYNKKNKKPKCTVCKKSGHTADKCWSKNKVNKNEKSNTSSMFAMPEQMANMAHTADTDVWCLDSGCTSHMTGEKSKFHNIEGSEGTLRLASKHVTDIKGTGTVAVKYKNNAYNLTDTLYVPDLTQNLLSVGHITEHNRTVLFEKNNAYIKDETGKTVMTASKKDGLYLINLKNSSQEQANIAKKDDNIMKWHKKLAHLNVKDMKTLLSKDLVSGLDICQNDILENCDTCVKGKMSRLPFPKTDGIKSKQILEVIHTDLCGPMPQTSLGGAKYVLTFIDDYSRYCYVYFLKNKSDTLQKFKEYKEEVENFTENKIKFLQSDNGTEYCNKEFDKYLKDNGIQRRLTTVYTPQQNGLAERKNRSLVEKARCMLIESMVPENLWAEAMNTANYIINRCPAKALNGETPYLRWVGRKPSVRHLNIFGSKTFTMIKQKRSKFASKADAGVFIGYAKFRKAYRIYVPSKNDVIVTRAVKITDEMYFNQRSEGEAERPLQSKNSQKWMTDIVFQDILNNEEDEGSNDSNVDSDDDSMHSLTEYNVESGGDTSIDNSSQNIPQCSSDRLQRSKKPPVWSKDYVMDTPGGEKSFFSYGHEWHEAIKMEIKAHIKNSTWIIKPKENQNVVNYKMILKEKTGLDNSTIKKARLVAQGFTQRPGVDYYDTYAPVAKLSSIRTLLAYSVEKELKLHQMDVVTAYLNGELNENIQMKKPDYLEKFVREIMVDESQNENSEIFQKAKNMLQDISSIKGEQVCTLKKSLYGLKQSARQWFSKLDKELKKMDFEASNADPCIYINKKGEENTVIAIYVDDIIIAYSNEKTLYKIKKCLQKAFDMKDLGSLKFYLGLEIRHDTNGIKISQKKYIQKALEKYNMENCKPITTPIEPYLKLEKSEICDKNIPYQNLIGTLMYLSVASRPDISYAVSYLSQFNNAYSEEHFKCAKRVLRYLKGTMDIGICFTKTGNAFYGMADADWAGCQLDRKSYSGYCFKYANGCISWEAKKQKCVALSTAEAEYVALTEAAKEAIHLKMLFKDLGISTNDTIIIYSDNQAAEKLSSNPVISGRSKHIDIKQHFIRECVQRGDINILYKPTQKMEADILTKGIPGPRLEELRASLGLH